MFYVESTKKGEKNYIRRNTNRYTGEEKREGVELNKKNIFSETQITSL